MDYLGQTQYFGRPVWPKFGMPDSVDASEAPATGVDSSVLFRALQSCLTRELITGQLVRHKKIGAKLQENLDEFGTSLQWMNPSDAEVQAMNEASTEVLSGLEKCKTIIGTWSIDLGSILKSNVMDKCFKQLGKTKDEAKEEVATQIGREPLNFLGPAATEIAFHKAEQRKRPHPENYVTSVATAVPWADDTGTPFPTLFWLTSQSWVKEVGKVENDVKSLRSFEQSFLKNYGFGADKLSTWDVILDHLFYINMRWSLIPSWPKDRSGKEVTLNNGGLRMLLLGGVGGNQKWEHVRCCHMHIAFYLAMANGPTDDLQQSKIGQKLLAGFPSLQQHKQETSPQETSPFDDTVEQEPAQRLRKN